MHYDPRSRTCTKVFSPPRSPFVRKVYIQAHEDQNYSCRVIESKTRFTAALVTRFVKKIDPTGIFWRVHTRKHSSPLRHGKYWQGTSSTPAWGISSTKCSAAQSADAINHSINVEPPLAAPSAPTYCTIHEGAEILTIILRR